MSVEQTVAPVEGDAVSDVIEQVIVAILLLLVGLVALPLLVPVVAVRVAGEGVATKASFWRVWAGQWVVVMENYTDFQARDVRVQMAFGKQPSSGV